MQTLHFDARFIRIGYHDGISRFSTELVKALDKKVDVVALIYDLRQLESLPTGIKYLLVNNPQAAILPVAAGGFPDICAYMADWLSLSDERA